MRSLRLYILDQLRRADAHGYQLRARAEEENTELWTDIRSSALYGMLKRLHAEDLIAVVSTEAAGNYPERTTYRITDSGLAALTTLRDEGLRRVVFPMDPFDLALERAADLPEAELRPVIDERRRELAERARATRVAVAAIEEVLSPLERRVVGHLLSRLDNEVAWHEALLADLAELLPAADNAPEFKEDP